MSLLLLYQLTQRALQHHSAATNANLDGNHLGHHLLQGDALAWPPKFCTFGTLWRLLVITHALKEPACSAWENGKAHSKEN